jgi:hypothetical protein
MAVMRGPKSVLSLGGQRGKCQSRSVIPWQAFSGVKNTICIYFGNFLA